MGVSYVIETLRKGIHIWFPIAADGEKRRQMSLQQIPCMNKSSGLQFLWVKVLSKQHIVIVSIIYVLSMKLRICFARLG